MKHLVRIFQMASQTYLFVQLAIRDKHIYNILSEGDLNIAPM